MSERDLNPGPERPPERGTRPERPPERGTGPERPPERGTGPERPPERRPGPAPVAEIEAEIKAEIAAEMEAERLRAVSGPAPAFDNGSGDGPEQASPDAAGYGGAWPEPPPPVADPAAEVLAWLRGEFDDVNANIQSLSNRLGRQEEAVLRLTGSQEEELNSTLAELEGCSAQLRNEASVLRDTRAQLAESLPKLVAEAVQSAVVGTVAEAVAEMRGSVAQLGAALSEALPAAVADALAPATAEVVQAEPGAGSAGDDATGADEAGPDLVTQLHDAQDEAAEWFTIVVDEAVRRAVERWLVPAVPAPQPASARAMVSAPAGDEPAPAVPAGPGDAAVASPSRPAVERPASEPAVPTPVPEVAVVAPAATVGEASSTPSGATAGREVVEPDSGITCVLPGVTVGPTLAIGVSGAMTRARLRRRRRRLAGAPAAGLFRQDPYTGELSRRLDRFALARRDLAWTPALGSSPAATVVVAAEREGREVAVDLGSRPLALCGPGAGDASRALLATLLAGGRSSTARILAAEDLLPPGPPFPGLDRFDDLATAIDGLAAEVGRRITGSPADAAVERGPVVMFASVPAPGVAERLARLVEQGPGVGITLVVVGEATAGTAVVDVDGGGQVRDAAATGYTELAGARMFGLDLSATSEVLAVLAAARTDDEPVPVVEAEAEPFPVLRAEGPAPIQVRVLGPYRIDVGGEEIRSGLRAKARELLAFYLLHPEGTTLDVATEALWPEADPGRGSEWFWTALGNLRSRLRNVTGTKELKVIERDGDRYRIEPVFDVDLWRFQAALPPVGAGTGDPEWAAALQGAADMYDGELLAGVDWAWADVPREDLRRRAVDVLVSLGATRLVAGDVRGALDVLSHAVEVDPLAEQVYRRIMRLHAKQGHLDEVEAAFARMKARLADLGLEPTAESQQLVKELVG